MTDQPPVTSPDAVSIARIEGKIDRLIDRVEDLHGDSKDHETRLRSLESNETRFVTTASARWWFTAIAGLIVAATSIVALVIR